MVVTTFETIVDSKKKSYLVHASVDARSQGGDRSSPRSFARKRSFSNLRLDAYRCSSALTSSVKALVTMISEWNGTEVRGRVVVDCYFVAAPTAYEFAARDALLFQEIQETKRRAFEEARMGETVRSTRKKKSQSSRVSTEEP